MLDLEGQEEDNVTADERRLHGYTGSLDNSRTQVYFAGKITKFESRKKSCPFIIFVGI